MRIPYYVCLTEVLYTKRPALSRGITSVGLAAYTLTELYELIDEEFRRECRDPSRYPGAKTIFAGQRGNRMRATFSANLKSGLAEIQISVLRAWTSLEAATSKAGDYGPSHTIVVTSDRTGRVSPFVSEIIGAYDSLDEATVAADRLWNFHEPYLAREFPTRKKEVLKTPHYYRLAWYGAATYPTDGGTDSVYWVNTSKLVIRGDTSPLSLLARAAEGAR